ncbi:CPBP family archaeomyxosortase MrtA [Pyrococcus horikoshii]|uniref:CPBP family intramembrane metalloprotease n=1 Tax=Pyrococcus horikoshii TaxID=53953 RepID=A0A832T9D0_PYRHR|nr:CPBP family archaeomyxosortase MrtA [Pyrococcus horikoshii]HII60763.1 CPBP family intramembrane metalloprotease [Pyrococcus horikoshii]
MREVIVTIILAFLSFTPALVSHDLKEWVFLLLVFYVLTPILILKALKIPLQSVGIRKPKSFKSTLILLGAAVVLSFIGLLSPEMKSYYPRYPYHGPLDFILYEALFGIVMLSHELMFRGFMLFPLAKRSNIIAIVAQDIPYTILHVGKPFVEIPYAFIAGIVFAIIDLKEESVIPSFLVHWIGSAFFDFLCIIT